MKINYSFLLIFFLTMTLSSCKQDIKKILEAATGNILEPVSMTVTPGNDLGEIVVGETPIELTIKVRNNSSDQIRKIVLTIDNTQTILKFKENEKGESVSPGLGGTCQSDLSTANECSFVLLFNPRKSGIFSIPITLDYENYIEPQQKTITIKALTGEPASLVFTNDISTYDLGVVEQTEDVTRYMDLNIANQGGLTARSVTTSLLNSDSSDSFKIVSNTCNTDLKPQSTCKIRLSYTPYNNSYTDPTIEYKGQVTLSYARDSKGTQGNLNGYASFLSATIEAKFKENFKTIDFGTLFTGNKLTKSVRISNNGYRAGVIKEMILSDYQGHYLTTCKKGSSGKILDCSKELKDFPFIIEDSNSCFDNQTEGIVGSLPGSSCYFNITYWPSLTWESGSQATHYFNEVKIALKYDSQWKGSPNIIIKNEMFDLLADFLSAGKLALYDITFKDKSLDPSSIVLKNNAADIDLGRIALVSSDTYSSYLKITWKNIGENIIIADRITDKHSPVANLITELGYDINVFYQQIKTSAGCGFISPGATCSISFNLAPVVQANSAMEDQLMFDDISDVLKKIKTFSFVYDDGAKFEDNGDASTLRTFNNNLTAKLIKKGSLAITSPLTMATNVLNGQSDTQHVCLTNVGTGDIYAIVNHSSENFIPKGTSSWPFKVQKQSLLSSACAHSATKDCYDIIYNYGSTLPMVPDTSKFLSAGETCVLEVETKIAETYRVPSYTDSMNFKRPFSPVISNSDSAWERKLGTTNAAQISYTFLDGDYVSTDSNSYLNYGYQGATKKISTSATFAVPGNIVLTNPSPVASTLFYRPAITYPSLSSTYPNLVTLASYTTPEVFFPASYFLGSSQGFTKSDDAITHVKSLNLNGGIYEKEYKVHIGTFPVGQTNMASFDFTNTGDKSTYSSVLTEDSNTTSPIQVESFYNLTAKPFPPLNIAPGSLVTLKLKFTPTTAGLFKRCFNLNYNNGLEYLDQYVCVYGEAVASFPKIKIEYTDVDISLPGPIETVNSTYTEMVAPINYPDGSFTQFSGIKDSSIYVKKIIRLTNVGNASAKKLNSYYMVNNFDAKAIIPTDTTIAATDSNGCTASKTLAPGEFCNLYIKYQPTKSSAAALVRYLGVIYEIAPDSNQYISQIAGINFSAVDPAKLMRLSTTAESITDWSNPSSPLPVSESWPFDLSKYDRTTNTHLILDSQPQSKTLTTATIANLSLLKASFLYMNPTPGPGTWNQVLSNSFVTVLATRGCFYGDDENNASIPASKKGFNSATVNVCRISVQFTGNQTYTSCSSWNAATKTKTVLMGTLIDNSCNPYVFKLNYYNNDRASYETMYFHIKGFIEPNRSTTLPAVASFSNVSATFTSGTLGKVTFSWPTLTPLNSSWGSITKYRIYYDTGFTNLNSSNIFKLTGGPSYVETANINSVTIPNLTVGKYYFFRVMAVRSFAGLTYISDSNLPLLTLPIPGSSYIYQHDSKTLVDKTYMPTSGNRPTGITVCGANYYNFIVNGTTTKIIKSLISSSVWKYLITDPSLSSGYPADGIGSLPHWLSDAKYDMKTSISLYDGTVLPGFPGHLSSAMSGNNPSYSAIFQKNCNNNTSCDLLYKIVGGDDVDLYYKGVFFTNENAVSAFYRCHALLRCPTNVGKVITDSTCALP